MFLLPFLLLTLLPFAAAAAIIPPPSKRLPSAWHHADDHPVHALFRRDPPTTFVPVGSPSQQDFVGCVFASALTRNSFS